MKILVIFSMLLVSCAHSGARYSSPKKLPSSPAELQSYIKKNVDQKTLKQWENVVSHDTIILEIVPTEKN